MCTNGPGRRTPRLSSRLDSRAATLTGNIEACLADWRALGAIERNVEIKIVAPLLELLGWDPVLEVNWGFQIPIAVVDGRRVTREADVVIADEGGIYLVGEVKALGTYSDPWAAIPQLLNYMHALGAERGFVTDGHTWLIVSDRPLPLLHPFPADQFDHVIAEVNIAQMPFKDFIGEIRAHLAPDSVEPRQWPHSTQAYGGLYGYKFSIYPDDWHAGADFPGGALSKLIGGLAGLSETALVRLNFCATVSGLMLCTPQLWSEMGSRRDSIGSTLLTINTSVGLSSLYVSTPTLRDLGCARDAIHAVERALDELYRQPTAEVVDYFISSLGDALSNSLTAYTDESKKAR
jgi:hypothetical protein